MQSRYSNLAWALVLVVATPLMAGPANDTITLRKASELLDLDVVNDAREDLGEIEDIVIDPRQGDVLYAVVSFGGWLDIGDKLFAVPFKRVHFEKDRAVLNVSKELMEKAPGFNEDEWPKVGDPIFNAAVHAHFGEEKFWRRYVHEMNQTYKPSAREGRDQILNTLRVSEVDGMEVIDSAQQDIGEIDELVLAMNRGMVACAVVSIGGLWDIGDEHYAIPWEMMQTAGDDAVLLKPDKEQVSTGPRFASDDWPDAHDTQWFMRVYAFYNVKPQWEQRERATLTGRQSGMHGDSDMKSGKKHGKKSGDQSDKKSGHKSDKKDK